MDKATAQGPFDLGLTVSALVDDLYGNQLKVSQMSRLLMIREILGILSRLQCATGRSEDIMAQSSF